MKQRTCKDCRVSQAVSNFKKHGRICHKCKIIRAEKAAEREAVWRKGYAQTEKGKAALARAKEKYEASLREEGYTPGWYKSRKLSEEQVRDLRANYKRGDGKIWAAKLGISQPAVCDIVNMKSYKEVV